MTCEQCREVVSAGLDGEAGDEELAAARDHASRCAACRAWARQADLLARQVRVRPADPVPDLSRRVEATAGDVRAQRRLVRRRAVLRVGLVGVAIAQLVVALPQLSGYVHAGNEVGAWAVATAVGLLTAAASPRRVSGLLPVLGAAAGVLVSISVRDVVVRHVPIEHELSHLLLLVGVALLWMLRATESETPPRDGNVLMRSSSGKTTRRAA